MPAVDIAEIHLWGRQVGAIFWDRDRDVGTFQYTDEFLESGIEPAPLTMPLAPRVYAFPELRPETFKGLPGLVSDSLPDRFGNLLIDQWLAGQGREPVDFSPVERLCYIGERGMGALEFHPLLQEKPRGTDTLDVANLVRLANDALVEKQQLRTNIGESDDAREKADALRSIIQVGTSAGGARAKAVIAWHPETGEIRSGQVSELEGYEPWLIKFDGVDGNRDKELADPQGYGKIEFAYHLMARAAGIEMSDCRLLRENGRAHFMTRRFDRTPTGKKLHMQSLCAMGHYDFNLAGGTSYEQAVQVMRKLDLPREEIEQQFRRTLFQILSRNQDDHTKNIAFLMDKSGEWSLSPAFDVTFAYNQSGEWTGRHQMSVNGKRDDFEWEDFLAFAKFCSIKTGRAKAIVGEMAEVLARWPEFAAQANVEEERTAAISGMFRNVTD